MNKLSRFGALLATSSVAIVGAPALAQTTASNATSSSAVAPDSSTVGEVIVKAQRREESLQKVPVAVSVVSNDQLSKTNFSGLTDLQFLTPSVQYNSYQGGGFEIRGVGTQSFNTSEEQEVAVVIDDVVQGTPETNLAPPFYESLADIDHLEVLKGPQGTLFGKNSSAGVLQIITKRPQIGVFSDDTSVSYGSRNEVKFQDIINIPVNDQIAARVSAYDYHQDGFENNLYTSKTIGAYSEYGVRAKLLWQPSDNLDVYIIGEFKNASNDGNGIWTLRNCGSGGATFSPCPIAESYGVVPGPRNLSVADDGLITATSKDAGGSLHIDYKIGEDTLTAITAFYDLREVGAVDVDQTPTHYLSYDVRPTHSEQFTQEFRLSSPSDRFAEYTVGAFYYNVQTRDEDTIAGTLGLEPDNSTTLLGLYGPGGAVIHVETQSYAAFGQTTLHLTDQLRLIGGVRYTYDNIRSAQNVVETPNVCQIAFAFGAPCLPTTYPIYLPYFPTGNEPFSLPSKPIGTTVTASNLSGKIGLEFNFTRDVMAYATFARGYKGPAVGYNPTLGFEVTPIPVQPELSTDYEVGVKTTLFEHHLTLNADAFYTKYTNFQAQTFMYDAANPGLSAFVLDNAGGLETKGFEIDAVLRPTSELSLTANLAYMPTRFTQFNVPCTQEPAGAGPLVNPPTPHGTASCFADPHTGALLFSAAGYPLANAPKVSYVLAADYKHPLGNGYSVDLNVNWNWRDREYTVVADPNTIVPAYGVLGANLAFGPEDGRWQVSLFARNLLNQYFVAGIFPSFFDNGAGTGNPHPVQGYSNIPNAEALRTIGMKLDVKFGG